MKIIGVVGSPRRGKNTGTLVERVLQGAADHGARTTLFYVNNYTIPGCQGCDACKTHGACVHRDDMDVFYDALADVEGLVIGTPIYLDHISGQLKTWMDRLYAYLGPNLEHRFVRGVKAVLIATWGASQEDAYDDVIAWLEKRLSGYLEIETVGVVKAWDRDHASVLEDPERLREAYAAGERLASVLRQSGSQ